MKHIVSSHHLHLSTRPSDREQHRLLNVGQCQHTHTPQHTQPVNMGEHAFLLFLQWLLSFSLCFSFSFSFFQTIFSILILASFLSFLPFFFISTLLLVLFFFLCFIFPLNSYFFSLFHFLFPFVLIYQFYSNPCPPYNLSKCPSWSWSTPVLHAFIFDCPLTLTAALFPHGQEEGSAESCVSETKTMQTQMTVRMNFHH